MCKMKLKCFFMIHLLIIMSEKVVCQENNQMSDDFVQETLSSTDDVTIIQENTATLSDTSTDSTLELTTEFSTEFSSSERYSTDETETTEEETLETTEDNTTTIEGAIEDCNITDSVFILSDKNDLTIIWNISIFNVNLTNIYCREVNIDIQLTELECNAPDCTETVSRLPIKDLTYTFKRKLEACAKYTYRIIEKQWEENVPTIERNVDAKEQFQKIQINIVQEHESSTSLQVDWAYNDYPLCPRKFKIEVREDNVLKKEFESSKLSETINDLEPCVTYSISVLPFGSDKAQVDFGDTEIHTMNAAIPSGIQNLDVEYKPEEKSIDIKWTAPNFASKCVRNYVVAAQSNVDNRSLATNFTNEKIVNVFACTTYTVKVYAATFYEGMQGADVLKELRVPSRAFTQPSAPRVVDFTSDTVTLNASIDANAQRNYCKINRVEFRCVSEESDKNRTEKALSFTLTDLIPYTFYKCYVRVENSVSMGEVAVFSNSSDERVFTTKQGKPDTPSVEMLPDQTSKESFSFRWNASVNPRGEIKNYNIFITFLNFSYFNPSACNNDFQKEFVELVTFAAGNEFTFREAFPFAYYSVQVQAENGEEVSSYSPLQSIRTLPGTPDRVTNLQVNREEQKINETYNKTTSISWNLPCRPNAKIVQYIVECRTEIQPIPLKFEANVTDNREDFVIISEEFLPDSFYNVSVWAVTDDKIGQKTFKSFDSKAGLPDLSHWRSSDIVIEPSTNIAKLTIPRLIFESDVGKVTKVLLLIAELGCENLLEPEQGFINNEPKTKTWREVEGEKCIPLYQTGSISEETVSSNGRNLQENYFVFTVGTETCETNGYCNGPLRPGSWFALTMRVFTRQGWSDTDYITIKTENEVPLMLISISILSVMFIVFVAGFYISYRKTRTLKQESKHSPYDNKDIPINEFKSFHREMIENSKEKIIEEYKAIQSFSESLEKTCIASKANEKLNRYTNISPFDYNRVVLNDDEFENDYINASYINGYHYPREYIAAQGPKPNTGHDFWRMVLQHKVESIVMLTSLTEDNKVKCHEYFPKLNGKITFSNINIICTAEEVHPTFIKRTMEVEKEDVKHTLKHYYYSEWPDHGVPANASLLIEFCKSFRMERQKASGTIIVHCSAGVGRTGTFIGLDILIQRMKQEKKINIFDLVKQLRSQRIKMVQTIDQYLFLYTSAMELSESRRQQPQVFQNISIYFDDLKLFKRLKMGANGSRKDKDEINQSSL